MRGNAYLLLGLGLLVWGSVLLLISWFLLHSTPLVALGMSLLILGAVSSALSRAVPRIPPRASSLLLQTGLENISSLLEELGLEGPAYFLPSKMTGGKPKALIPLHSNPSPSFPSNPLPARLLVRYGSRREDVGILISVPGSSILGELPARPGPSPSELEASLAAAFSGILDAADGARVWEEGGALRVEILNPRLEHEELFIFGILGSPLASLAGILAAEAYERPVVLREERREKNKLALKFEFLR